MFGASSLIRRLSGLGLKFVLLYFPESCALRTIRNIWYERYDTAPCSLNKQTVSAELGDKLTLSPLPPCNKLRLTFRNVALTKVWAFPAKTLIRSIGTAALQKINIHLNFVSHWKLLVSVSWLLFQRTVPVSSILIYILSYFLMLCPTGHCNSWK